MFKRFLGREKQEETVPDEPIEVDPFDLDYKLFRPDGENPWRIRDACEGTQIFGGTGSGKTSGSGRALASLFIRAGMGGLVLCAKPDEVDLWRRYAAREGREEDLVIFGEDQPWRFNFLDYEQRVGGGGVTENLVALFLTVMEYSTRSTGGAQDPFWERAVQQLLRNAIDLLRFADEPLSLPNIHKLINSAPTHRMDAATRQEWMQSSYCFACIAKGEERAKTPSEARDFELAARFWLAEYVENIAEKTRQSILVTFTSMADGLMRGLIGELFQTETNITPDDCFDGKVIILNLPSKLYHHVGITAQVLFKYVWQRAVERRDIREQPRPVFLFADESQFFITTHDREFQSTARSVKACTVYLTQNLDMYFAALGGGQDSRTAIGALLGNLQTKIFHQNSHGETNEYASELIGRDWQTQWNSQHSESTPESRFFDDERARKTTSTSTSSQKSLEYLVMPTEFARLNKGGPDCDFEVEGVIYQGNRQWENGHNFMLFEFPQKYPGD